MAQLILERSEYKFRFALMGNATMFYFVFLSKIDPTGIIHLLFFFILSCQKLRISFCSPSTAISYRIITGCEVFPHREKPVFITRNPCNENRLFPVRKTSQGKPCFHYRDGFAVQENVCHFSHGHPMVTKKLDFT